jgi:hypothetical protein
MVRMIDQSTRRKDGPEWACAGCGERWPRRLVGTPFPSDRCYGCGGELVTAPATGNDCTACGEPVKPCAPCCRHSGWVHKDGSHQCAGGQGSAFPASAVPR